MAQVQKVSKSNTTVSDRIVDGARVIEVTLHRTKVCQRIGNYVKLDTGGWTTTTTRTRMNQFANEYCSGQFSVSFANGDATVRLNDGTVHHFNGSICEFRIL